MIDLVKSPAEEKALALAEWLAMDEVLRPYVLADSAGDPVLVWSSEQSAALALALHDGVIAIWNPAISMKDPTQGGGGELINATCPVVVAFSALRPDALTLCHRLASLVLRRVSAMADDFYFGKNPPAIVAISSPNLAELGEKFKRTVAMAIHVQFSIRN